MGRLSKVGFLEEDNRAVHTFRNSNLNLVYFRDEVIKQSFDVGVIHPEDI